MREIKFRAWDKVGKKIFENIGVTMAKQSDVYVNTATNISVHNKNCVIMQFTGLKDKNGKEIYEGDIVQVYRRFLSINKSGESEYEEWEKFGDGIGIVFFDEKDLSYRVRCTPSFSAVFTGHGSNRHFEVLGNIYENPELKQNGS